ncbi:hypothetical protein E143388_06953 [Rhodococcus opacus]|nr:hypothetical protein E143388_06953 [Rhodococcus opacus]
MCGPSNVRPRPPARSLPISRHPYCRIIKLISAIAHGMPRAPNSKQLRESKPLLGLVYRRREASHPSDLSVEAVAVVGIGAIVESHRNLRGSVPFQSHGLREHLMAATVKDHPRAPSVAQLYASTVS